MVLILSRPCFSVSRSKRVNTSSRKDTTWFGVSSSARRVKFTTSANITETSANPSAIVPGWCFEPLGDVGRQDAEQQLLGLFALDAHQLVLLGKLSLEAVAFLDEIACSSR